MYHHVLGRILTLVPRGADFHVELLSVPSTAGQPAPVTAATRFWLTISLVVMERYPLALFGLFKYAVLLCGPCRIVMIPTPEMDPSTPGCRSLDATILPPASTAVNPLGASEWLAISILSEMHMSNGF